MLIGARHRGRCGAALLGVVLGVACADEPTPALLDAVTEAEVPAAATEPTSDATPAVAEVAAIPDTSLPLTLLATEVPGDPGSARATIRDHDAGTIAHYRVGDAVHETAIIASIDRGSVTLVHDEQRERLAIGIAPAQIAAGDVFYADLVDDTLGDSMQDGVQLDTGPGWMIKTPAHAWGTPRTVHRLREALRSYARAADGGPDVHVGDLSRAGGGPFPPHLSHQTGRDVDIGYVLHGRDADVPRFLRAHAGNLDRARTWALVYAILETRAVAWIFMDYGVQAMLYEQALEDGATAEALETWFQYPRGNRAMRGMIRDWRGHDDHFHVRLQQ